MTAVARDRRTAHTASQRVAGARVQVGNALANAVPDLATRERLADLIDAYGCAMYAQAVYDADAPWRKALESAERIHARNGGNGQ